MDPKNIAKLEQYRSKLEVWRNDQSVHLEGREKDEILQVIREEFNPGYHADLYCGSCVVKMMEYAFQEMDSRLSMTNLPGVDMNSVIPSSPRITKENEQ